MYKPKIEKDIRCPLEYGMDLFGGRWKSRIICLLARRDIMRYSELKKELVNITDTVLASTLKELSSDGMISRIQYNEIPPRVEYSLSAKGKTIVPILKNICSWAGLYYKDTMGENIPTCNRCSYRGEGC